MACSALYCTSKTTRGGVKIPNLSFHVFPKCPAIKNAWVKAIGRESWEPGKYARICSKHFDKSCYIDGLSVNKLKSDAIPTIFEGNPLYHQPVPKEKRESPVPQDEFQNTSNPHMDKEKVSTTSRQMEAVVKSLIHSKKVSSRRLKVLKRLRDNNRRLVKKIAGLLNIINELEQNNVMDAESMKIDVESTSIDAESNRKDLSSSCDINKEFLLRLQLKQNNQPLPKRFSPQLRKFALMLHFLSPRAYKYARIYFDACLPHPKTICKWYQVTDCEPAFTEET